MTRQIYRADAARLLPCLTVLCRSNSVRFELVQCIFWSRYRRIFDFVDRHVNAILLLAGMLRKAALSLLGVSVKSLWDMLEISVIWGTPLLCVTASVLFSARINFKNLFHDHLITGALDRNFPLAKCSFLSRWGRSCSPQNLLFSGFCFKAGGVQVDQASP